MESRTHDTTPLPLSPDTPAVQARREYLEGWMRRLELAPADADWLVGELMRTNPEHGYRALTFQGAAKRLGRYCGPEARKHFEAVAKEVSLPPIFSIVPLDHTMILNALQARYYVPEGSLSDGLQRTMELWMQDMRNSPLSTMMQLATYNSAWAFLKMQSRSLRNWQNFGVLVAERHEDNFATLRGTDIYPSLSMHQMPHVVQGLLHLYERDGRVTTRVDVEEDGTETLVLEVRW